jgi:hypothetical protein
VPTGSKPVEVTQKAVAQLRFDEATSAAWSTPDGKRWSLFFFDWKYGPAFSRVAAQMHRPDICLPATGCELEDDRGLQTFETDGKPLPFHAYTFRAGRGWIFVYHGVWQVRSERGLKHGPLALSKQQASVQSVLWRERWIGQQSAEIAVAGCADAGEADAAFARMLPLLIVHRKTASTL